MHHVRDKSPLNPGTLLHRRHRSDMIRQRNVTPEVGSRFAHSLDAGYSRRTSRWWWQGGSPGCGDHPAATSISLYTEKRLTQPQEIKSTSQPFVLWRSLIGIVYWDVLSGPRSRLVHRRQLLARLLHRAACRSISRGSVDARSCRDAASSRRRSDLIVVAGSLCLLVGGPARRGAVPVARLVPRSSLDGHGPFPVRMAAAAGPGCSRWRSCC